MNKLITRAKLAGKILRFVPFLKMAALNGSVSTGSEKANSDIDILIIAKSGRLYTCRFFATILIHLTGWRRHGKRIAGRICLNCYLAEDHLSIIPENKKSIPKVVRAYKYMILLIDSGVSSQFCKANKWFGNFKVAGEDHSNLLMEFCFSRYPRKPFGVLEKALSGKIGNFLEVKLMAFQLRRIYSSSLGKNDEIYADTACIKLHPKKANASFVCKR